MSKNLDITMLAAEFANDFDLSLSVYEDSGSITLEDLMRDVVSLSHRPGSIDVVIDFIDEDGHEGYTPHNFDATDPDAWVKAKVLFRQAALDYIKEQKA